ncbi:hypothetical protein D3C78_1614960 [compost metagenome]
MRSTSLKPVYTSTPARLATGMLCSTLDSNSTNANNHRPWKMVENRVVAPA